MILMDWFSTPIMVLTFHTMVQGQNVKYYAMTFSLMANDKCCMHKAMSHHIDPNTNI